MINPYSDLPPVYFDIVNHRVEVYNTDQDGIAFHVNRLRIVDSLFDTLTAMMTPG